MPTEKVEPGRILVVDDNELILDVICRNLAPLGHEIVPAASGRAALVQLAKGKFDVVVTDLQMPGVGGLEILEKVKERTPDLPVIMLSGQSEMSTVLEAIRRGAFDYVIKDSEPAPLHSAVVRALSNVRLVRRNHDLVNQLKEVNQRLEEEVEQRTMALRQSNARLSAEREQLEVALEDLQRTESRLFHADKIATIGMLTAGVAHEINNPLAFLIPNVSIIRDWVAEVTPELSDELAADQTRDSPEEILTLLQECSGGLARIRNIVSQLSLFSRQDIPNPERVQVSALVETLIEFTSSEVRHYAELSCDLDASCYVLACPGHLHQVLLNIIVNAARAISGDRDGQIHVSVKREDDEVAIAVRDNGVGIAASELNNIFKPFYTTRRGSEGTGLGLSISLELAQKMGGRIEVQSTLGVGTTMTLRVPFALPKTGELPLKNAPSSAQDPGRKTIVLVDDEEKSLRMFTRVLGDLHRVCAFARAEDALAWLDKNPSPDLLVCDMMMPGMNGDEFFVEAVEIHPCLAERTIFVTGGAVTQEAQSFLEARPEQVRFKPLSVAEIHELPGLFPIDAS